MTWTVASMLILGLALAAGFAWWERSHPPSRLIALVATLAALAAIGRIAFAPLPNVKPTTDIVLFAGYALGGAPGFAVGAVAALASNFFFGQGPWTPWQMTAWGLVGLGGAALAHATRGRTLGRVPLAIACGVAGLIFGAIMNLSMWVTYSGDHTLAQLGAYSATSFTFDVAHALGNVVFCLAFGPALIAALQRFRARMEVRWVPAGAAAACALALALAGAGTVAPAAEAAVAKRSVGYLLKAQNADGGFAGAPGQRSTGLHTGWTGLGLAAAGRNPLDVRRGGRSVIDYVTERAQELSDLGEIQRTILLLVAAGRDPRDFAGRDLVAEVLDAQRANGSFAGRVNTTAFAVLALRGARRSAGSRPVRRAVAWIAGQANDDGGFNFAGRGGASGIDDTSAALQGLAAAGKRRTAAFRRGVRFLLRNQNADGGFGLTVGAPSNAQSAAWAVQALVAARRNPGKVRRNGSRSPIAYLRSLTAASGAVRYSRTSTQTPVWVTGQALTALARKPFPLKPVARRARRAAAPAATPEPALEPAPQPEPASTPKPRRTPRPAPTPAPSVAYDAAAAAEAAHRAGLAAGALTVLV